MRATRPPKASWPAGAQFCGVCRSFVPLFYTTGSRCKACASAAAHARGVEKKYGITLKQYNALLKAQGGRCAICRCAPKTRRLVVDHQHGGAGAESVRGLLCTRCNHELLGGAHDDIEILRSAVRYLEDPPAWRG